MTLHDFMGLVLPREGIYCAAAINGKRIEHVYLNAVGELESIPQAITTPNTNIYYTPATFTDANVPEDDERRNQSRVYRLRSIWLDVDVGKKDAKKSYATKKEARTALMQFIADSSMPIPVVVDSGYGYHAYWTIDEDISPQVWAPLAKRLRAKALEHGLKIDAGCTTDSVRLLRFPGTTNYRKGTDSAVNGRIVPLEHDCPLTMAELCESLGMGAQDVEQAPSGLGFEIPEHLKGKKIPDPVSSVLLGETRFRNILTHKNPCQQLVEMVQGSEDLEEPMWRAGLSIAHISVDRKKAIRALSEGYPGYSFEEASKKADMTNGPYTCVSLENLNPQACKGCPHRGKISTPAQLGRVIPAAETPEDRTVEVVVREEVEHTASEVWRPSTEVVTKTLIPEYPRPYFRPKGGAGVCKLIKVPGEEDTTKVVYEYDFYVTRRVNDPDTGEALWFKLHLPQDGVREFSMPLTTVVAPDKLRDALAQKGVITVSAEQTRELFLYVTKWVRYYQMNQKAEQVRSQMGWTNDGTFVVGTREMLPTKDGVDDLIYCPPASRSQYIAQYLGERGDMSSWREVIDFYNQEGMEAYAFAVFLSFGAPLMQFTQLKGGVYNMVSSGSGAGKTTALMAANSIWGHPTDTMMKKDDTYNARIHRAGVLQHLPITVDEITNMDPKVLSDMMYASTSGKGKARMEASSNAERMNATTFQAPTLCTSNASIRDKLLASKSFPEGELMRVIEVEVKRSDKVPKAYTDMLFAKLEKHHGMAWVPYMRYIINNQQEVIDLLSAVQRKTDMNAGLTQRERVWSALAAVALTGGSIAYSLGLHGIDVQRVARWVSSHLMKSSVSITAASSSVIDSLADYMAENYNNALIIQDKVDSRMNMPNIPVAQPRGQLSVRIETDTRRIFLVSAPLRKWCAEKQVSYHTMVDALQGLGVNASITKKRVTKGTAVNAPPVNCLMIEVPVDVRGSLFGVDVLDGEDDPDA